MPPLVLQRALGIVMVLTALAIVTQADLRFQTALAEHAPGFLVNPTGSLERSKPVEERLAQLRGKSRFDGTAHASTGSKLKVLGEAPDFAGDGRWFNTHGRSTLEGLRGRVVLIDFWTYTCINCLRTLPHLRAWDARYRKDGLTIVGVHTPEFAFEHDAGNVQDAITRSRLRYPVVQDNDYATWNAWGNQYWPAKYLIDAKGRVRYAHFGEGEYEQDRGGDPHAARGGGAAKLGGRARVGRRGRRRGADAGDLPRRAARAGLGGRRSSRHPRATPARRRSSTSSRSAGRGRSATSPPRRCATRRSTRASPRARSTSCSAHAASAAHGRGARRRQADAHASPSAASASTSSSRCRAPGEHRLSLRFEPGLAGYAFTFG